MFTLARNTNAVLLHSLKQTSRTFARSSDYMLFLYIRPVFFFRHLLTVLLSHQEIVVEGSPCKCNYLFRIFLAKHPLFRYLGLLIKSSIAFISPCTIHTLFSTFRQPRSLSFPITVWVVWL